MKNRLLSTFVKGIAGVGLLLGLCDYAFALPITITGKGTFTLDWQYTIPSTGQDLRASALIEVDSFSDTELRLKFKPIKNTTMFPEGSPDIATLQAFGLDFGPAVSSATLNPDEVFIGVAFPPPDVNFPGTSYNTNVCVSAVSNCQVGSIDKGLKPGEMDMPWLTLTRATPLGRLATNQDVAWNLLSAPVNFQVLTGGSSRSSYSFDSCTLNLAACGPNRVPEPDSLSLVGALALSFGITVLLRRRRRN